MPDMKLASMKQEKRETEPKAIVERDPYPWGLQLHLDDETLEKLGIDELPEAGAKLMVVARANVESVSMNQSQGDGEKRRSVTLQIVEMAVGPDEDTKKPSAQDVLYKK